MKRFKKYNAKTNINNISILSKNKLKDLQIINDEILFKINQTTLEILSNEIELEYEEYQIRKIINTLKKHLITTLGILLIIIALFMQSFGIVGTKFTDPDTYNIAILEHLDKYYKKVGPYLYLNDDLNTINLDLRKTFYQYEWIGVRKEGAYLYLDIKEINNKPIYNNNTPGAYYAETSGIIKKYHVEKGIIMVQEEQYVDKDELLISGNIPKLNNELIRIRAIGYVIAEVLEYRDFVIPKLENKTIRSGKIQVVNNIYIFNKLITKNNNEFAYFEIEEKQKYNFFNFLKNKQITIYEVINIDVKYSIDEAIEYSKSMVKKDFLSKKVNPFEQIIFNELVKTHEDDNYYYIRLIVKSYKNIAKFIPYE